jgi:U2 snRNP auxiliary factor large subunit
MGKRSDSDTERKHKKHRHKHRRSEVLQSIANRRQRISNFDRPPQPYELLRVVSAYENDQKLTNGDPASTRYARRIYIGNLPESIQESAVKDRVSRILVDFGGIIRPGDPVVTSLYLKEYNCMLIEFRSLEETEAAITLNGMEYESRRLIVRRPADFYNIQNDVEVVVPRVNLNKIGLVSPFVDDEMNKILIGGLDLDFHEEHVKEMLSAFGQLKAMCLVKTQDELQSLGYAFCEFVNNAEAERACLALNGIELRGKTLVVRKVISSQYEQELVETSLGVFRGDGPDFSLITQYPGGCIQPNFETIMYRNRPITVAELIRAKQTIEVLQHRSKEVAQDRAELERALFASGVGPPGVEYDHRSYEEIPGLGGLPCITANLFPSLNYLVHPEGSSNIICIEGIVDTDRFLVDTEFTKMYDEIMIEVSKYGTVISLIIPRVSEGYFGKCIGKAYVEYIDVSSAVRSSSLLGQKNWKGNPIKALFFDSIKFMRNELD